MSESVKLDQLPLPELWQRLASSPDGLSVAEARRRLGQFGYNELPEVKVSPGESA